MDQEKSLLEMVSDLSKELTEISLYFKDDDVDMALTKLTKLIANPHVPANTAKPLVVQLQALSSKFALEGKVYMLYDLDITKEEKTRKKNMLLTLSAELEKLSNAVKYLVKD